MKPENKTAALKPVKKNFDFVDTIRCISMIGIVMEHCAAVNAPFYSNSTLDTVVETSLIQLFKFSTIAFFLIGGFLINHKFQEYTTKQYLKNRVKSTIKPWIFWMLAYIIITMLDRFVAYAKGSDSAMVDHFFRYTGNLLVFTVFFTSSWFVLNFLICICILLIFKRYLYKAWFGVTLAVISLFYSLNLYQNWFVTTHSTALFGFVFYLWLGVNLNKYYERVMKIIDATSWFKMICLMTLLFVVALLESLKLIDLGSKDPYNTLRVSNIVYSLGMFTLLLKLGSIKFLQEQFEPRKTTFGIYLVHFILIMRLLPLIFSPLKLNFQNFSVWTNTGIHLLRFIIVYGVAFFIVKLITKTKFKWIVGA